MERTVESNKQEINNRVNNLLTQNNPTEGNSELIDIRTGVGGKVYPSAGEAVRGQVKALDERIFDFSSSAYTPKFTLTPGYLNASGKPSLEAKHYSYSDGISLLKGQVIKVTSTFTNTSGTVAVIGKYNDGNYGEPLVVFDPNTPSSEFYYQAVEDTKVSICVKTKESSLGEALPYEVKILTDVSIQLFNEWFSFKKTYPYTNYFNLRLFSGYIDLSSAIWKQGYWNPVGSVNSETGQYTRVSLEPNTDYIIVTGGFIAETTVIGLDTTESTKGKILTRYKGNEVQVARFTTTNSGIVGICTNKNIVPVSEVVIAKDCGLLSKVIKFLILNESFKDKSIFELKFKDQLIPSVFSSYVDLYGITAVSGYWDTNGARRTETGESFSIQLEVNKTYCVYVGGYANNNTSIVELATTALESGTVLAIIPAGSNFVEFTPKNTGIVGICTNKTNVSFKNLVLAVKEPGILTKGIFSSLPEPEPKPDLSVYYVGGGDTTHPNYYTNLITCFNTIKNIKEHKTVHIYSGTYDIYALMGGDEYFGNIVADAQPYTELQPFLDNVTIIGHGNVKLIMEFPTTISKDVRWLFSPLNLRGNFIIDNLMIEAKDCRYCIHDESGANYPGTVHEYKNIRCVTNVHQAVGCGYSRLSTIKIDKCRFESGNSHAYSYHSKGGCNILISDSVLISKGTSCPLRLSEENTGNIDRAVVSNCYLKTNGAQELEIRPEWNYSDAPVGYTNVRFINTKINAIRNGYTTVTEEVTSYNTLEGTETVLIPKSSD